MVYTASCHCGAIRLEMQRTPRRLTQCNCSICRRYGAIWAYFQRKSYRVIAPEGTLRSYTWLNERFDFHHCGSCGCVTHYERREQRADGSDMGAVNIRNIDDPTAIALLPIRLLGGASSWKTLGEAQQPWLLRSPSGNKTRP